MALSVHTLTQQCANLGFNAQSPVSRGDPGPFDQPFQCGADQSPVTGPLRCLGQLRHDQRPEAGKVAVERAPCGIARGIVAPQAVMEHRACVVAGVDQSAETAYGRFLHHGFDQLNGRGLLPSPGREHHGGISVGPRPGRLRDQPVLVGQLCGGAKLAPEHVGRDERGQCELQVRERACVSGELDRSGGQGLPGFEVPQLNCEGGVDSRAY